MRRLARLVTGGALWLILAALPASADGGPHNLAANSGTSGLAGDCAACHRAHTAKASNLLKDEMPALCTDCHNGSGATTDVLNGVQFVPDGLSGSGSVMGALRSGGFTFALIDSANAARVVGNSPTLYRGKVGVLTVSNHGAVTSTHGGVGTVWGNGVEGSTSVGATGATLECASCHNPHGNGQYRILQTKPGADWTGATGVTGWTAAVNAVEIADGTTAATTLSATLTSSATSVSVASATAFPAGGSYVIFVDGEQMLVTAGQGATSWTVTRGANGTTPATHASGAAVATHALSPGQVRNYTVLPGALASNVVGTYTAGQGDYWRWRLPWTWTGLTPPHDSMQVGWNGSTPTSAAQTGGTPPANSTGLMTAWCVSCHTRYSGTSVNGDPSSLQPHPDPTFMYLHGTENIGCEQCHVSHGSNAQMTPGAFSNGATPGGATFPDGGAEDSALLKVDNRGTCQMCHDPTETTTSGTYSGPIPAPGVP